MHSVKAACQSCCICYILAFNSIIAGAARGVQKQEALLALQLHMPAALQHLNGEPHGITLDKTLLVCQDGRLQCVQ